MRLMKFKKGISILADNGIALYAIKPVVDKLKKKNRYFCLYICE